MSSINDPAILLIGKTGKILYVYLISHNSIKNLGAGKSTLGNMLLGRNEFIVSGSAVSDDHE